MKRASVSLPITLALAACGQAPPEPADPVAATAEPVAAASASAPQAVAASAAPAPEFDQTLQYGRISFHVVATVEAGGKRLSIAPAGLLESNEAIAQDFAGTVTGAEVGDIDSDGSPEVYVYLRSTDAQARSSLVAYAVNKGKSMSAITVPDLADDPVNSKGYQGHDEFAVVEGIVARRFPIYAEGVNGLAPSGRMRQLQYKLSPGEATWQLKLDQVVEF